MRPNSQFVWRTSSSGDERSSWPRGDPRLVYYEMHRTMDAAILRETRIKKWKRAWKVRLIEQLNPEWIDLFDECTGTIHDSPADRARMYR